MRTVLIGSIACLVCCAPVMAQTERTEEVPTEGPTKTGGEPLPGELKQIKRDDPLPKEAAHMELFGVYPVDEPVSADERRQVLRLIGAGNSNLEDQVSALEDFCKREISSQRALLDDERLRRHLYERYIEQGLDPLAAWDKARRVTDEERKKEIGFEILTRARRAEHCGPAEGCFGVVITGDELEEYWRTKLKREIEESLRRADLLSAESILSEFRAEEAAERDRRLRFEVMKELFEQGELGSAANPVVGAVVRFVFGALRPNDDVISEKEELKKLYEDEARLPTGTRKEDLR